MPYGFYYDWTYIFVLIGLVFSLLASGRVNLTFSKYSKVNSRSGLTGAEAAARILQNAGIRDVTVRSVAGKLTDHYDPRNKTLNLSEKVYSSTSVAALGVAAHECGHAIQDQEGYAPLRARASLVPIANIGSTLAWPMIILGIFLSYNDMLINLGILFFTVAVLFHIVTLPVEFNASARAVGRLEGLGILGHEELRGAKKVLSAAAMTYVASAAVAILELIRLLILVGNRSD